MKSLALDYSQLGKAERKKESALLSANTLKVLDEPVQHLLVEDLAALDTLTDSTVLEELKQRFETKKFQTFIGDILLTINPYEHCTIYGHDVSYIETSKSLLVLSTFCSTTRNISLNQDQKTLLMCIL